MNIYIYISFNIYWLSEHYAILSKLLRHKTKLKKFDIVLRTLLKTFICFHQLGPLGLSGPLIGPQVT